MTIATQPLSTIDDVATLAGVSTATVSRVLNKTAKVSSKTEKRVQRAMEKLGYRPNKFARGLAGGSSDSIGVVVPDIASTFFGTLIKGVESAAREHGVQVMIASGNESAEDERRAFESLEQHQCDARIIFFTSHELQHIESMTRDPHVVVIGRYFPELAERCVYLNDVQGGIVATEHLIEQGHRQIAHLYHNYNDADTRWLGYRQALDRAGIAFDPDLTITVTETDADSGYRATARLLTRGKPFTAIFAFNDRMAMGCIAALRHHNLRVPEDVSVIGFDDIEMARYFWPPLTTVHQPIFEMAHSAGLIAIGLMKGEPREEVQRKFEPTLVTRDSVQSHTVQSR
jgi:LacI family transcriptional regulator